MEKYKSLICIEIKIVFLLAIFICSFSAFGQDDKLQDQAKELAIIADFADTYCKSISMHGDTKEIEMTAEVEASLSKKLSMLANLGINAGGKVKYGDYSNVLQKDLLSALKTNDGCRRDIWNFLKEKMITSNNEVKKYSVVLELSNVSSFESANFDIYIDSAYKGSMLKNSGDRSIDSIDIGSVDAGSHNFSLKNTSFLKQIHEQEWTTKTSTGATAHLEGLFYKKAPSEGSLNHLEKRDCSGSFDVNNSQVYAISIKLTDDDQSSVFECSLSPKNNPNFVSYEAASENFQQIENDSQKDQKTSQWCSLPLEDDTFCRVMFSYGKTSTVIRGNLSENTQNGYLLRAKAGQRMSVRLSSTNNDVTFIVFLKSDNIQMASFESDYSSLTKWSNLLPKTGDYIILIKSKTYSSYELNISIT
jgi:hypothetical protein